MTTVAIILLAVSLTGLGLGQLALLKAAQHQSKRIDHLAEFSERQLEINKEVVRFLESQKRINDLQIDWNVEAVVHMERLGSAHNDLTRVAARIEESAARSEAILDAALEEESRDAS